MNRLHSILMALALGTVPCVGAVAIRALWALPAVESATSAHFNGVLDGFTGVETKAGATMDTESARLNKSLDNLDKQVGTVGPAIKKLDPVLDNVAQDTAKLGTSIDLVTNRVTVICPPKDSDELHPCGTLADLAKTLNTVRGTFGEIRIAANHENRNLGTLDTQEAKLFEDFDGMATRGDTTLDTFNGLLANPNVTIMLANGAEFTTTAVALENKLAQCTLHPTLPCVLKSDILFGAQVGGYLLK
jgi:ABC-type transporter Mla subunit MlaD